MNYCDFVTKEYFSNMNKNRLKNIKDEAITRKNNYQKKDVILELLAKNIAYFEYPNFTFEEKQILASNICLNDEEVINTLLDAGIDYNTLYSYSNFISKYKKLISLTQKLGINNIIVIDITANKNISYINSIISSKFDVLDFNLITTKLNEIAATKKTLYMKLTTKIKKR